MRKRMLLLSLLVVTFAATAAFADTVTDTTIGVSYTLTSTFSPISTSGGQSTFAVTLAIDTSGYNGNGQISSGGYLDAVALLNFANQTSITLNNVNGSTSMAGLFTQTAGGLNSSGCDGSGNFVCWELTNPTSSGTLFAVPDGTYDFTFYVTVNGTTLNSNSDIKAFFTDNSGANGGLTSMAITVQPQTSPVPEPTSMMLLGSGLLGMAGYVRRKLRS